MVTIIISTILVLLVANDPNHKVIDHVEGSPSSSLSSTTTDVAARCDFEKYSTGCYSRSGLVCNQDTNLCQCDPDFPVSIGNICVKRVKANQICQYNEQCDNENGFYCSYSDHKLINNCLSLETSHGATTKCKCIKIWHKSETYYDQANYNQQQHKTHQQSHTSKYSFDSSLANSVHPTQHPSNAQSSSILPRLVWFVLISCLLGLCLFLLYIKVHEIGQFEDSFQQHEDRLSINSEPDVPPPYEVAIRMKQ